MDNLGSEELTELLTALGEYLEAEGGEAAIVVVGGTSLAVMNLVPRTTKDVDVIARAEVADGALTLVAPDPLPPALQHAIERVARDYSLDPAWLNTQIGSQWDFGPSGLPPTIAKDITWKQFSTLRVGFVGRHSLIFLKLFAATDQDRRSHHYQDLIRLRPSEAELRQAAEWVQTQDTGAEFSNLVEDVIQSVLSDLEGGD